MTPELRELQRLAVEGNVARLTPQQRAVVVLRLGWDRISAVHLHRTSRSQSDVAFVLGLSQRYVSTLEAHAKEALREQVQQVA